MLNNSTTQVIQQTQFQSNLIHQQQPRNNNNSPAMTIQLTSEDQQQISILTEQLKKIVNSSTKLSPESEKIVKFLEQQRSAILEKNFLLQQRLDCKIIISFFK